MGGLAYRNMGPVTLTTGEAMAADRLVKMSGITAVYCGAGEVPVGETMEAVVSGVPAAIAMLIGIVPVTAANALAAGVALYTAASGMVSDTPAGSSIGVALSAATGAGGKISMICSR
jgi:hypothetical protein